MQTLSTRMGPLNTVERAAIIEEFWASRNAWADAMNAERLSTWEKKWAGLSERDLPANHTKVVPTESVVQTEQRVLPMRRKKAEVEVAESELPARVPAYRFYWQPKSLQIPMP